MKIKGPNWSRVSKQMLRAKKLNNDNVQKALEKSVIKISAEASRNAPVKTGTLRRSITQFARLSGKPKISGTEMTAKVGSRTHYARHQEEGTRYVRAKRFLIGAIEKNRKYTADQIYKAMGETIRKA